MSTTRSPFLTDIETLRRRAREHIEEGRARAATGPTAVPKTHARTARALERALSGFAVLALGYWAWVVLGAQVHYAVQDRRLQSLSVQAAPAIERRLAAATRAEMERTGLIGRLEVPRLGLAVIVEEGVDKGTLRHAAGHVPGTPLPGEPGNVVVATHRDTLFRPLRDIHDGDELRFVTPDGSFAYKVVKTEIVNPADTDVLASGSEGGATLITCYPFGFVGPAPERFVVRAARMDRSPVHAPEPGRQA